MVSVTKLDAADLDTEFDNTLKSEVDVCLKWFPPDHNLLEITPELQALFRIYVWKETLWKSASSVGQSLLGVHLDRNNHEWKSILVGCIYALGPLIVQRRYLLRKILPWRFHERTRENKIESVLGLARTLNLVMFLYEGKYPTLVLRLLKWKHVPIDPDAVREVSFEYMTRELLWNSFAELFTGLLPIFDVSWLLKMWSSKTDKRVRSSDFCAECENEVIIPTKASCGHYFCYYCLQANLKKNYKYRCPLCNKPAVEDKGCRA